VKNREELGAIKAQEMVTKFSHRDFGINLLKTDLRKVVK
jgi:hypothetical protein